MNDDRMMMVVPHIKRRFRRRIKRMKKEIKDSLLSFLDYIPDEQDDTTA